MFRRIRKFLGAPVFEDDEAKTRVAQLLNAVLWAFLVVLLVYGISIVLSPNPPIALSFVGVIMAANVFALLMMRRGRVYAASLVVLTTMWLLLTLVAFLFGGVDGPAVFGYVVVVVMAGLLLGRRGGLFFAVLIVVSGLAFVWARGNGFLPPPVGPIPALDRWAAMSLGIVMTAALLFMANRSLDRALGEARHQADELDEQRKRLEEVVGEQRRVLDTRALSLEATSGVARIAASATSLEELLSGAVMFLSDRFGFYHAGVFLMDQTGEWAVLRAASSEGGERMLARGHRLGLGVGIVGHAVQQGEPRIALDVGQDAVFFDNPDLPDTRSEMALPMRVRGEIIGVLDVQSMEPGAFGQEDVAALQTSAEQLAMAIDNARLVQQSRESFETEQRVAREMSREAWGDLLSGQHEHGLLRTKQGAFMTSDAWRPEMDVALQTGETTRGGDDGTSLAIPIRVGGQIIGVIDARRASGSDVWAPADVAMIETLTDQLGVALESARLYQDTQRRAVRDRLVGQATTRMRESLDVQRVLETAADELYQAFGLDKVVIRLATEESEVQI